MPRLRTLLFPALSPARALVLPPFPLLVQAPCPRVRACAGEEAWVAEEVKVEEELGEALMLDEHVVEKGAEALHMEAEVTQFQQQDLPRSHPRSLKAQTQTTPTPVVGPPGLQALPDIASVHTQTYQDTSLPDPTAFLNLTSTGALDAHAQTPYASRMHLGADFSSAIDVGAGPVDAVIGGYALTEADMQAQAFVHPARAETFLSAAVPDTGQAWMGVAYEDGKDDGDVGETYQDPDGERDADGETDLDAASDRSVRARSGSNVAAHSDIDMVASVGMDMDTGVARQVSVHASTEKSLSVEREMDFGLRTGMDNPGGSFGYEGNGTIDPSWLGRTGPEAPSPEKNAPQEESAPVPVVSSRRRAASRGKGKQKAVVQSSDVEAEDPASYTSDEDSEYRAREQQKAPKTKLKASARSKAKSKAIPKSTSRRGSTSRSQVIVDEAGPSRPQLAKQTKPRRSDVTNANMREAYKPVNIFAEPVIVTGKRQRKPTARLLAHKTELPRSRSPASSEDSASTQSGDNAVKSPARSVTRSVSPGKGKRSPNKQKSKADRSSTLDIQLSFCHQCRNTSAREKMKCSVVKESGEPCGLRYCIRCVVKRYPEIEFDPLNRSFVCPRCSDSCCCDACCRKRGETYVPPPRGYVDPETLEFIPKDPNEAGHGMLSPSPDYSYETPDELPPNGADAVENGVYWGAVYSITGQRIGGGFIGDGKRGVVVKTTPLPPSASIQSNGATDRLSSPSSSSSSGSEVDGEVGKRVSPAPARVVASPASSALSQLPSSTSPACSPPLLPTPPTRSQLPNPSQPNAAPANATITKQRRTRIFIGRLQPSWNARKPARNLDRAYRTVPRGLRAYVGAHPPRQRAIYVSSDLEADTHGHSDGSSLSPPPTSSDEGEEDADIDEEGANLARSPDQFIIAMAFHHIEQGKLSTPVESDVLPSMGA
ncbi:hypothetical protein WOLCODRAFT_134841 [Wolfiporia cocos MD-104 SS10]|uniref:Zinc-finger domain-containing protein n=1 Tax=Wolfiporia cocos (strain MD-104) TaxID=742152 RepID=A0A2H3J5S3_WOLCO|nr:hypothetical protein WOLCODRAFT_134841 [Wolfiporia cocos MD-104 SS10]